MSAQAESIEWARRQWVASFGTAAEPLRRKLLETLIQMARESKK